MAGDRQKPSPRRLDANRAADILRDAFMSSDAEAAKRWGVSTRTIERYRARAPKDVHLSGAVTKKLQESESEWRAHAVRCLQRTFAKLEKLIDDATVANLRDVNGTAKLIGELLVMRDVVAPETPRQPHVEPPGAHRTDPSAPAPSGGARPGAGAGAGAPADTKH